MNFAIKFFALLVVAVIITETLSMPAESVKPAEKSADEPAADAKPENAEVAGDETDARRCILGSTCRCPPGQVRDRNGKCRKVMG